MYFGMSPAPALLRVLRPLSPFQLSRPVYRFSMTVALYCRQSVKPDLAMIHTQDNSTPCSSALDGFSPGLYPPCVLCNFMCFIDLLQQRLGRSLDRPDFPWKSLIVGFSLAQYFFETYLSLRQYKVLKQTKPPKSLAGEVSQDVFDKSQVRHKSFSTWIILTTAFDRPMDAPNPTSAWSRHSMGRFRITASSTMTPFLSYGLSPASGSSATLPPPTPARSCTP